MDKFVERQEVLKLLNVPEPEERLANLAILLGSEKEKPEVKPQFANNHIHTIYSFSPYSSLNHQHLARAEFPASAKECEVEIHPEYPS